MGAAIDTLRRELASLGERRDRERAEAVRLSAEAAGHEARAREAETAMSDIEALIAREAAQ